MAPRLATSALSAAIVAARPLDINFEVQHRASSDIAFLRGPVAESLPRPAVELRRDPMAVVLGECRHAAPLGEVLPQQPVGVLVGPPFPRVVRGREVEPGAGGSLDRRVVVALRPVVGRDGPHRVPRRPDQLRRPPAPENRPLRRERERRPRAYQSASWGR